VTRGVLRRIIGGALLALSVLPVFRILDTTAEAPFRRVSVQVAEATLEFVRWGAVSTLLLAVALALLLHTHRLRAGLESAGNRLLVIPLWKLATCLAITGMALATAVERLLFRGFYSNVDEIASVIQARYLAAGELAGTLPGLPEAWLIPNMMMVDAGWASQFPPSHLLAMALSIKAGILPLMGPLLLGAFVFLWTLVIPRLLVDTPRTARLAAIGVALSPFLFVLGAGGLSHTSAGLAGVAALYAALRARDGHPAWSVLVGASIGFMVASRPWIGLVLGCVATLGIWGPHSLSRRTSESGASWVWFLRRALGTLVGGAPFAGFLAWYNLRLFGSVTSLGYLQAFGERHRLGFHVDPWGYDYSLLDAIGFTSSDLLSFGLQLLETPIPLGALVGVWLLSTLKLPRGARFLVAWALIPVAANALYWFHATRMLYEATPAWIALAALATVSLSGVTWGQDLRVAPRDVTLWGAAVALLAALGFGAPTRLLSYRWSDETVARVTVPDIPTPGAALVFVHSSWNERLSSQLQGAGGMRQDTVITSIRRNTQCELHLYTLARERVVRGGDASVELPSIDLLQVAGTPEGIERQTGPGGMTLRVRQGDPFPAECLAELRADRFCSVALAPLLWQGALPGIESAMPLFVRDLGPQKNERLKSYFPDRTPYLFVPKSEGADPEIVPYEEGMRVLWGRPPPG
jgi:hypothetical protein